MARRIVAALSRRLRENWPQEQVHFHAGDRGRPYVCDNPRCTSPALDVSSA